MPPLNITSFIIFIIPNVIPIVNNYYYVITRRVYVIALVARMASRWACIYLWIDSIRHYVPITYKTSFDPYNGKPLICSVFLFGAQSNRLHPYALREKFILAIHPPRTKKEPQNVVLIFLVELRGVEPLFL